MLYLAASCEALPELRVDGLMSGEAYGPKGICDAAVVVTARAGPTFGETMVEPTFGAILDGVGNLPEYLARQTS